MDACILTLSHTHTHTHTHLCIQTIVSITPISSYPELYAICFYESDIITLFLSLSLSLSLSHTHTHTHVQTALSLACIDFKIIFFFPSFDQNVTSTSAGSSKSEDCSTSVVARFSACSVMFSSSNISCNASSL